MSINIVSISGNLTRDAELKVTQNGTPVLSGSVAVNERVKQGDQWTDKSNYVDWVLFGARAEKIAGYLTKGTKVAIMGRLSYSSWTDKQTNQKRSKLEVVVTEIEFFRPSNLVMDATTAQQVYQQAAQQVHQQQQQTYRQQMNAYYQQ